LQSFFFLSLCLCSAARAVVRKVRLLAALFGAVDVHVLPFTIQGHKGGTKTLAVSSLDDKYVLTGGYDAILRIWDASTGVCLAQFVGHTSIVTWCCFVASDTQVLSCSFDATLRLWNVRDAKTVIVFKGHQVGAINHACFFLSIISCLCCRARLTPPCICGMCVTQKRSLFLRATR
jgi:WD40 repeat protein